jgi:hypothetical protein
MIMLNICMIYILIGFILIIIDVIRYAIIDREWMWPPLILFVLGIFIWPALVAHWIDSIRKRLK